MRSFSAGDVKRGGDGLAAIIGPRQPPADPGLDRGDGIVRQFSIGRHLEVAVVVHDLDEQARLRLACNSNAFCSEKGGM